MNDRLNRLTVTLNEDSIALLKCIQEYTGDTPANIVAKLFPSHLNELWEYAAWLDQLPEGRSKLRSQGELFIHSYRERNGLLIDIARADPEYAKGIAAFLPYL